MQTKRQSDRMIYDMKALAKKFDVQLYIKVEENCTDRYSTTFEKLLLGSQNE